MRVSLDQIAPDPKQPRKLFDVDELDVLAASILANGLMQAVTLRPNKDGGYWIVAGERRWRAHCLLVERGYRKFAFIDAVVKEPPSEGDLRVRQVVENVVRADLSPLEEARAYHDLIELGMTESEAAERVGVKLPRFQAALSLLNLAEPIQKLLAGYQLERAHALEIARLPRHEDQTKILQLLNSGELNRWHSLRKAVDAILEGLTQQSLFGDSPVASDDDVATVNQMEQRIERAAELLSHGWRDGECVVATKVSPDRASRMADLLFAIRSTVAHMEKQLRHTAVQARLVLNKPSKESSNAKRTRTGRK
jgi:ParB family transcriptional regulator, chromosome partitioning protein